MCGAVLIIDVSQAGGTSWASAEYMTIVKISLSQMKEIHLGHVNFFLKPSSQHLICACARQEGTSSSSSSEMCLHLNMRCPRCILTLIFLKPKTGSTLDALEISLIYTNQPQH